MPAAEERVGLPVPPPKDEDLPGVRGGEDAGLREMGRRLQVAENRLDEVTDARDRLERQMSAQAEELRVQRAAIARVQRVLRTLARPDEATEPAPRDPNRGPAG
jgi:hypothetical protein